jgi:hypothetical protein
MLLIGYDKKCYIEILCLLCEIKIRFLLFKTAQSACLLYVYSSDIDLSRSLESGFFFTQIIER